MTPTYLAFAAVCLFGLAAHLAIWSRRETPARAIAVALFLIGLVAIPAAFAETLGRHKPYIIAHGLPKELHVVAAVMRQDEAIYLYIALPGRSEPLPLALPWDNAMASKIQQAIDNAPEGSEGQFLLTLDESADHGMSAHPMPQPAQPPAKTGPADPGVTYVQPGS